MHVAYALTYQVSAAPEWALQAAPRRRCLLLRRLRAYSRWNERRARLLMSF